MQRSTLTLGLLAALTSGALAADRSHPPIVETEMWAIAPFDWTGWYVGAYGGRGSSNTDMFAPAVGFSAEQPANGDFGGAQLGYDFQADRVVIGIQTDIAKSDVRAMEPGGGEADWLRWFGATTAKLGLAGERVLVYGKAGVSYGRASGYNGPLDNQVTRTHVGWAAGAGAEYAVTGRITVFAEYNYLDLGEEDYVFPTLPGLVEAHITLQSIRGGMNFRF